MKLLILGLLIVGQSLAASERSKREADPLPIFALPELPNTQAHAFLKESSGIDDVFNSFDSVSVSTYNEHYEHPVTHEHEHKPATEQLKTPHEEVWPIHDEYGPPAVEYGPPAVPEVRIEQPTTTTEHYCPTQDYQAAFVPSPPEIDNFPLPEIPIVPLVKIETPVVHETYGLPTEIPVVIPEVPVYHETYGPPAVPIVEEPTPVIIAPEPPHLAPLPEYVPPVTTLPPQTPKSYPYAPPVVPETTIIPEVKSEIPVVHEVYGPPPVPETSTVIIPPEAPTLAPLPPYIPPVTTTLPPYIPPETTLPPITQKLLPYPPPTTQPPPVIITLPPTPETTLPPLTQKLLPYPPPTTLPPTTTTEEPTTVKITAKKTYPAKVHSKYEDTHHHTPRVVRSKRHLKRKWAKPVVVYKVHAAPSYHHVKAVPNYHHKKKIIYHH